MLNMDFAFELRSYSVIFQTLTIAIYIKVWPSLACFIDVRVCLFVGPLSDLALYLFCFGFVCLDLPFLIFLSCLLSVLSCLVVLRNTKLRLGTWSCGIRVRPRTHHVPHGSCGPWKHLLARSGFAELVPVVVHFPQLMWLFAFSVTFAPLACKIFK